MCLGHESSGVIVQLGPDVSKTVGGSRKLQVGQRVALEPGVVCRVCEFCKAGQYEVSP
jgi:threonine dehydrogenase-like Zn-dependent dehydrogenase